MVSSFLMEILIFNYALYLWVSLLQLNLQITYLRSKIVVAAEISASHRKLDQGEHQCLGIVLGGSVTPSCIHDCVLNINTLRSR